MCFLILAFEDSSGSTTYFSSKHARETLQILLSFYNLFFSTTVYFDSLHKYNGMRQNINSSFDPIYLTLLSA